MIINQLLDKNNFELFKSNICHKLKEYGDIKFLIDTIKNNNIRSYFTAKQYPESFYLLAMVDYLSRINNIPLCNNYDDIRKYKLKNILYPAGILSYAGAIKSETIKNEALKTSIPEFLRFNIIESDIRNVN